MMNLGLSESVALAYFAIVNAVINSKAFLSAVRKGAL